MLKCHLHKVAFEEQQIHAVATEQQPVVKRPATVRKLGHGQFVQVLVLFADSLDAGLKNMRNFPEFSQSGRGGRAYTTWRRLGRGRGLTAYVRTGNLDGCGDARI